jgi:hypothetical protein
MNINPAMMQQHMVRKLRANISPSHSMFIPLEMAATILAHAMQVIHTHPFDWSTMDQAVGNTCISAVQF